MTDKGLDLIGDAIWAAASIAGMSFSPFWWSRIICGFILLAIISAAPKRNKAVWGDDE